MQRSASIVFTSAGGGLSELKRAPIERWKAATPTKKNATHLLKSFQSLGNLSPKRACKVTNVDTDTQEYFDLLNYTVGVGVEFRV